MAVYVQFRQGYSWGKAGPCTIELLFLAVLSYCLAGTQVGILEPPIMELSVRGATNTYTNNGPNSGDTEMALDMQVRPGPQ